MKETARDAAAAVAEALDREQFAEAARLLDSAVRRWPANAKLQALKGALLEKAQGGAQAALHYAGLAENPATARLAARRLSRLVRKGAVTPEIAAELVRRVSDSFIEAADKERILHTVIGQVGAERRHELLELLGSSGIFEYEWELAVRKAERGDFDGALEILDLARREGRTSVPGLSLLAELYALSQRLPDAIALTAQLLEEHRNQPEYYLRLASLLQRKSDFALTGNVIEAAIRRWPHNWLLLTRLHRMPVDPTSFETIFGVIADDAEDALDSDERFRLQFALLCLHVDQIERAQELLSRPFAAPLSAISGAVLKTLAARSPERWRNGSRLVDDRCAEVQIARTDHPRATIIVPTGVSFANLPLSLVDSLLADHAVNVVYLRDFANRGHLLGVRALGASESETIEALKTMVSDLGAPRTIVIGASAGGFAALRYGALLEADFAISFSGPTDLRALFGGVKLSLANPEFFAKAMLERETDLALDLAPLLSKPRRTKSILFYGAEAAADARQAQRLEGFPGVTLRPVAGIADNAVLNRLIGDGSFDTFLEQLIED